MYIKVEGTVAFSFHLGCRTYVCIACIHSIWGQLLNGRSRKSISVNLVQSGHVVTGGVINPKQKMDFKILHQNITVYLCMESYLFGRFLAKTIWFISKTFDFFKSVIRNYQIPIISFLFFSKPFFLIHALPVSLHLKSQKLLKVNFAVCWFGNLKFENISRF